MSNQDVGTPVFYINELSWLKSTGHDITIEPMYWDEVIGNPEVLLDLNPSNGIELQPELGSTTNLYINITSNDYQFSPGPSGHKYFLAILGHSAASCPTTFFFKEGEDQNTITLSTNNVVNCVPMNHIFVKPSHNGFSIGTIWPFPTTNIFSIGTYPSDTGGYAGSLHIGSIALGQYYEMPHSPDLNLTMTRRMDSVKTQDTLGGGKLFDYTYSSPPRWQNNLAPWEMAGINFSTQEAKSPLSRKGTRQWDLSFSYLKDVDVLGVNQSASHFYDIESGYDSGINSSNEFIHDITDDNSFISKVIAKTHGGTLPFIFQPDKNNANIDQFAICKLDMNSIKIEQVASGMYNMKLKIREVW